MSIEKGDIELVKLLLMRPEIDINEKTVLDKLY